MVVFTCNNCGESLQKPRVAKHLQFHCRKPASLSCVDCFKDFRGEEYVAHTKCITEAERYGGKDYVAKPGANKGEQKQQQWLNVINSLLATSTNLTPAERNIMEKILKYDNIPRKKAKFYNFINSMSDRTKKSVIDSVWAKMEATQVKPAQNGTSSEPNNIGESCQRDSISKDKKENNIAENENNENISRENKNQMQQNATNNQDNNKDDSSNTKSGKKKKSRKRDLSEASKEMKEQSSPKKKIMSNDATKYLEQTVSEDASQKSAFNWKNAICTIVATKQEISINKLQKKIIAQYMSQCADTVPHEKAVSKFNKKLKKIAEIVVAGEKVKLA